jgi:hypothetical protein
VNENKAVEPWAVKFTGEANEAVLLDRPNHWALAIRFNGEYTVREQGFIAQRIAVAAADAREIALKAIEKQDKTIATLRTEGENQA